MTKWMGMALAMALVVAAPAALAADSPDVMVVRGAEVTGPVSTDVEEARGPGSVDEAPARDPALKVSRLSPTIYSGRSLWMVNPDNRQIISCDMFGSQTAGKKRIKCFSRTYRSGKRNPFLALDGSTGAVYLQGR